MQAFWIPNSQLLKLDMPALLLHSNSPAYTSSLLMRRKRISHQLLKPQTGPPIFSD
jgi:hypothetical protein